MDKAHFSRVSFWCAFASLTALLVQQTLLPHQFGFLLAVVNLFCLFEMQRVARKYARESRIGFDHMVAAEAIIAFGVFSLVFGVTFTAFNVLAGMAQPGQPALDITKFYPFGEGLLTAGIAPIFAIFLRLKVTELHDGAAIDGDMDELATATAALVRQMMAAEKEIASFTAGITSASHSSHGLADRMKDEADKWALALVEGQAQVKQLAEASRVASGELNHAASASKDLKSSAADTSTMLNELANLIAAVERFVAPRSARK